MPYIKTERRRDFIKGDRPKNAGELNYLLTKTILSYVYDDAMYNVLAGYPPPATYADRESYALFNEVMGVIECVKQEFYRCMVVPYEQLKLGQNGDVF